jgi:cytochrome c oxidase subunit II
VIGRGGLRHLTPRPKRWTALALVIGCTLFLAACSDAENNGQNPLDPKGPAAERIDNLFVPIFWVAVAVGVFVLAGVLFVAFRFRYREGKNDNPKQIHGSTPLEIGWTIAPAVILAVIAVPTIVTIFDLHEAPAAGTALEVEAVGKQWWWEFKYDKIEDEPAVVTANELVIPTGQPVRVRLSACDDTLPGECNVLHSFWVPELAGKLDVVPGRPNKTTIEADKPGTYLGQCAEYCGLSHANMRFRVIAKTPADFEQWLREQREGPAVPLLAGDEADAPPAGPAQELVVTEFECTNCHLLDSSERPSYGPNLTHLASRTTFASGYYTLNRENLIDWVLDAPGMIPMQSKVCRLTTPAADNECVGMPSFTEDTPKGMPVMTRAQAEQIADYLLELT